MNLSAQNHLILWSNLLYMVQMPFCNSLATPYRSFVRWCNRSSPGWRPTKSPQVEQTQFCYVFFEAQKCCKMQMFLPQDTLKLIVCLLGRHNYHHNKRRMHDGKESTHPRSKKLNKYSLSYVYDIIRNSTNNVSRCRYCQLFPPSFVHCPSLNFFNCHTNRANGLTLSHVRLLTLSHVAGDPMQAISVATGVNHMWPTSGSPHCGWCAFAVSVWNVELDLR